MTGWLDVGVRWGCCVVFSGEQSSRIAAFVTKEGQCCRGLAKPPDCRKRQIPPAAFGEFVKKKSPSRLFIYFPSGCAEPHQRLLNLIPPPVSIALVSILGIVILQGLVSDSATLLNPVVVKVIESNLG